MIYGVVIFLIFIIVILFVAANSLFNVALNAKKDKTAIMSAEHNQFEESEIRTKVLSDGDEWYDKVKFEDAYIYSNDNLKLHGNIIVNTKKTNIWIIVSHGYFGDIKQTVSLAKVFYDLGYNLLLVDARASGNSEGNYIGMGYNDKYDIAKWIDYLNDTYNDIKIVLFGVSMGAATVMMCSSEKLPSNVKCIIEDCGYTSVFAEFAYQSKLLYKVPSFPLINILSIVTKIRAGFWLGQASPIDQVKKSKLPILFIHGNKDTFVPPFMVDELYENADCKKEKLIINGAGHGACYWYGSKKYCKTIKNFIDKHI